MPDERLLALRERRRRERKRRKILFFFFALFFLLFLIFAGRSLSTWLNARREQNTFDALAGLIENDAETGSPDPAQTGTQQETNGAAAEIQETDNRERFAALYELNHDFIGWLTMKQGKCFPPCPPFSLSATIWR